MFFNLFAYSVYKLVTDQGAINTSANNGSMSTQSVCVTHRISLLSYCMVILVVLFIDDLRGLTEKARFHS